MKSNLRKLILLFLVAGVAVLSSCYPDSDITTEQSDIVITTKDDSVDFSKIKTYYLPEKVFIVDTTDADEPIEHEQLILSEIESNLNDYGYERITDTTNAEDNIDVIVIATAYKTTVTSIWYPYYPYYPGWGWDWWGYPGWGYYPPGWGYYPPGYYPPYVTQFTMGSVKIDMVDPWKTIEVSSDTIIHPNYWMAGVHGLLQGGNVENRIKTSINQAFEQSPYLKH